MDRFVQYGCVALVIAFFVVALVLAGFHYGRLDVLLDARAQLEEAEREIVRRDEAIDDLRSERSITQEELDEAHKLIHEYRATVAAYQNEERRGELK